MNYGENVKSDSMSPLSVCRSAGQKIHKKPKCGEIMNLTYLCT